MDATAIAKLEKLLGGPRDGALLRYSIGSEWLKIGQPAKAIDYLRSATERDPAYSAAWKLLGKSLAENGQFLAALDAYEQGTRVAEAKGDIQAAKEMAVFARRLRRHADRAGSANPYRSGN